jgi:phage head maturation protease
VKTDNYYGYVDKNGSWYILQEDTVNNTYSYASIMNNNSVITGYAAAWSGRESLTYGNFNDAF